MRTSSIFAIAALLALLLIDLAASGQRPAPAAADKSTVEQHIAGWKQKPREAATTLMGKYGLPHEATAQRLIWHGNGPWKRSEVALMMKGNRMSTCRTSGSSHRAGTRVIATRR
jgi:hypothetical protein